MSDWAKALQRWFSWGLPCNSRLRFEIDPADIAADLSYGRR
jgi:hypothetical protein